MNQGEDRILDGFNDHLDGTPFGRHVYRLVWNYVHFDLNTFSINNEHLGNINPKTNKFYKLPVEGRIFLDRYKKSNEIMNKQEENIYEELDKAILESSDLEVKKILSKFNVNDFEKESTIFSLLVENRISILKYIYDQGLPFTYVDESGANMLHIACGIAGSFDVVKFLISRNICTDINAKTDENETPFLLAVMYDHKDTVKYFIKNFKPDLSIKTIYGDDALSLAKKTENLEMVKIIENIAK